MGQNKGTGGPWITKASGGETTAPRLPLCQICSSSNPGPPAQPDRVLQLSFEENKHFFLSPKQFLSNPLPPWPYPVYTRRKEQGALSECVYRLRPGEGCAPRQMLFGGSARTHFLENWGGSDRKLCSLHAILRPPTQGHWWPMLHQVTPTPLVRHT